MHEITTTAATRIRIVLRIWVPASQSVAAGAECELALGFETVRWPSEAVRLRSALEGRPTLVGASRPHRHRRLAAVVDPDPAVLRVARRRVLAVLLAQLRQLVGLDRLPLRLRVDAEQLGGVQAEDLVLDLVGQLRVLVLLPSARRASSAGAGGRSGSAGCRPRSSRCPRGCGRRRPTWIIWPSMCRQRLGLRRREHVEGAAQLEVDVLDLAGSS